MTISAIVLENLRKEFPGVVAVTDMSLEVEEGEIFGLIGPNGAGKTTTLRMLATALEPTSGVAYIEGTDIWKDTARARALTGFMPDFFQLYDSLTVRELFTYFGIAHGIKGEALRARVEEVIRMVGLAHKRDSLLRGLSRGMVQRLGWGRAVLHRPRVLLLDEPASGLDPAGRRDLFDILQAARAEGTTTMISSHILDELYGISSTIGIMHEGALIEKGSPGRLMEKIMPGKTVTLLVTSGHEEALKRLSRHRAVSRIERDGRRFAFGFGGSDEELAGLNASLVSAGVGVALVEARRADPYELYRKIIGEGSDAAAS